MDRDEMLHALLRAKLAPAPPPLDLANPEGWGRRAEWEVAYGNRALGLRPRGPRPEPEPLTPKQEWQRIVDADLGEYSTQPKGT